jgi:hypothetical protein
MNRTSGQIAGMSALLPVQTLADIEFLVKESEVLTGQAGRRFVVASADRLAYRIHWHPLGLKVERLDDACRVLDTCHLLPWGFAQHSIAQAQACGQLFTVAVSLASRGGH